MISYVCGDLFDSQAQALVNTVNCVGIMGKGIALAFKKKYPDMYHHYKRDCESGKIQPGILTLYRNTDPWIINFPTKRHWKSPSRIEDIEAGLKDFIERYKEWHIASVAMPALGCGHGGLDWKKVRPLMEKYLENLDINIEIYEPSFSSQKTEELVTTQIRSKEVWVESPTDLFGNSIGTALKKRRKRRKLKEANAS